MPTWRHVRSRICARAVATADEEDGASGAVETATVDLTECEADAEAAADTEDFGTCVVAEREAAAAVHFAE